MFRTLCNNCKGNVYRKGINKYLELTEFDTGSIKSGDVHLKDMHFCNKKCLKTWINKK